MFPFQRSGELSFQTMDFVAEEDQNNAENPIFWTDANMNTTNIVDFGHNNNNNNNNNNDGSIRGTRGRGRGRGGGRGRGRGRGRSSSGAGTSSNCNEDYNEEEKKKSIHREVERQRRLEMSNLYASLRSSIPPQYTQGKRSTSDHIAEAANYIKDLEKNVKDLSDKRDELRASDEWMNRASNYRVGGSSSNVRSRPGSVVIEPRLGRINIDIDIGFEDESFGLSSALQVAFEEGLNVVSCTSTRVDDRLIHNIICEVTDISCVDFSRLQWRLNNLVS